MNHLSTFTIAFLIILPLVGCVEEPLDDPEHSPTSETDGRDGNSAGDDTDNDGNTSGDAGDSGGNDSDDDGDSDVGNGDYRHGDVLVRELTPAQAVETCEDAAGLLAASRTRERFRFECLLATEASGECSPEEVDACVEDAVQFYANAPEPVCSLTGEGEHLARCNATVNEVVACQTSVTLGIALIGFSATCDTIQERLSNAGPYAACEALAPVCPDWARIF